MKLLMASTLLAACVIVQVRADDKTAPEVPPLKKEPAKEAPKEPDAKDESQPQPAPVDPKQTAERIIQNAQSAGKRLGDKDSGTETRQLQKDILKDIDDLIRQAQNPPPMDKNQQSGNPPPMGGAGQQKQPSGANKQSNPGSGSRRERRNRSDGSKQEPGSSQSKSGTGREPEPSSSDATKSGNPMGGMPPRTKPIGTAARMSDLYKDVWGHLPERLRQEMDLYYREQFMPRYQELLRQYYSSLSERRKPAKGE